MRVNFPNDETRTRFKTACVASSVTMSDQAFKLCMWAAEVWEKTGELPQLPPEEGKDA